MFAGAKTLTEITLRIQKTAWVAYWNTLTEYRGIFMIDLSKARLPQNYAEMSEVEKVHTIIPVGRPPKTAFFQVHPDPAFSFETYIFDYERNIYIVFPGVAAQFPELVKPVRLVAVITRDGNPFLWPLRLLKDDLIRKILQLNRFLQL